MEKRWALSVPLEDFSVTELPDLAREAQAVGYTDAWSGETDAVDAFTPLVALAMTTDMRLGTAIADAYSRGPQRLASTAASLACFAPGRFVLGIGASSVVIVQKWNSVRFDRPVQRVRETAIVVRRMLTGERVVFEGETLQVDGVRLTRPPAEPVPIHIAALRPKMLAVAGEVGDGVILNFLSPEDVPKSLGVVHEAARAAGRDPATIECSARLFVSLDPPGMEGDVVLRRWLTAYLNVPTYRKFQEWLGRRTLLPMWDAWEAGDRRGALDAITAADLDALFIRGTAEERRAQLRRYMEGGVDTAFFHFMTSETEPERRRALVRQAIRDMGPEGHRP